MIGAMLASVLVAGQPVVADGDTLTINGQRIRLFGVDALEAEQLCQNDRGQDWQCGGKATQALADLVRGQAVTCEQRDIDQYGRMVAVCRIGTRDIGEEMVRQGWAVAFRKYSSAYVGAEDEAQLARRGIWSGQFDRPEAFRAAGRAQVATVQRQRPQIIASTGCTIKGNINRRGQRIYHLPGTKWYEPTRAEAMFCSEAEAQRAGFRRAIVK